MSLFTPEFLDRLFSADHVTVLTGAGASAESGIATFRDPDGLWSKSSPAELASYDAFVRNPVRVQSWYSARIRAVLGADPNPCHVSVAALEELVPTVTVVTQNVDRLHHRAGSTNVVELHGNLIDTYCVTCGETCTTLEVDPDASEPAKCVCGGLVRPAVVWFGETLSRTAFDAAVMAASRCDVCICIGTSAEVQPAASLPILASDHGSYVVEFNVRETAISDRIDATVLGRAGTLMPLLINEMREQSNVGAH